MSKLRTYKDLLEKFCKNLTLTTFPHAQELMFRNIFLNEIFYEIDVIEGKAIKGFSLKDIRLPADFDVDEFLRNMDEKIKQLEADIEQDEQGNLNAEKSRRILIYGNGL